MKIESLNWLPTPSVFPKHARKQVSHIHSVADRQAENILKAGSTDLMDENDQNMAHQCSSQAVGQMRQKDYPGRLIQMQSMRSRCV